MTSNLLHLFVMFAFCSCDIDNTQMIQISDMKNLRLAAGSGHLSITTCSALHCAVNCISNSSCVALSYQIGERSCLIYDFVFSSSTAGTVSENGWISYRKNTASCPTDRGYTYSPTLDWCYKLFTGIKKSVQDASSYCNQDGARLLRVNSVERQLHMTNFLISHVIDSIYIAGRSENMDFNYIYEDGTPLSYFNWNINQPAQRTSISMNLQVSSYVWNCGHGSVARDFMCEI